MPPYEHTSYKAQELSGKHMKVSLCNLEPGRHYVGLRGGHHCAGACDCHNGEGARARRPPGLEARPDPTD